MTHGSAFLASLIFVAAAPAGAQSATPAAAAPASSATSSTTPPSSAAAAPPPSASPTAAAGTDSTAGAPKAASSTTDTSAEPSADVLKKARREGFKPKKRNGVTKFCYSDATLGTRFETEKCLTQQEMEITVQQREDQRRQLQQPAACAGAGCSGH